MAQDEMIIVSACLAGDCCRYDGGSNFHPAVCEIVDRGGGVKVCPEVQGGLPVPRPPAEIIGGDGSAVIDGKARVINREGVDVTEQYLAGAYEVLSVAEKFHVKKAVLKARSPACGFGQIYDGSFSRRLAGGNGVAAAVLARAGVEILTEHDI